MPTRPQVHPIAASLALLPLVLELVLVLVLLLLHVATQACTTRRDTFGAARPAVPHACSPRRTCRADNQGNLLRSSTQCWGCICRQRNGRRAPAGPGVG